MTEFAPTTIYLDNNVWDFLFENQIDLSDELPSHEFHLRITREAEFEILSIPDDKRLLKFFIETTIARCDIRTDALFGLYDERFPLGEQRVAGLDEGRFASEAEVDFMSNRSNTVESERRKTRLFKNEADISLAARSFDAIVLTFDKSGPLNDAHKQGGKVIFLTDLESGGMTLRDFISASLAKSGQ